MEVGLYDGALTALSTPLIIVSPCFPPQRGGLADHTVGLARGLSARREVYVLTSKDGAGRDDLRVSAIVENWQSPKPILRALGQLPPESDILWQYVPHMYGRGGISPGLVAAIKAVSRTGRLQCLIAHEIATALSWRPSRMACALAHRYQWRQILKHIDLIGISTEAWLMDWRRRASVYQAKFFLTPSPSNIPVVSVDPDQVRDWRRQIGLHAATHLIGFFGTLHESKLFPWIMTGLIQAQCPGRQVGLVAVGDQPMVAVPDHLKRLFRALGYLPAAEVSVALQAVDVLALPFADGVAERRTTFMAGLDHGCPILTTLGPSTGPTLRQGDFFCGVGALHKERFVGELSRMLADGALRLGLGQAGRKVYQQRYAWPRLIETIEDKLDQARRRRSHD
jgi:glycosyltransferase involved in cell wall biosynthesis